jgi:methyl-accepting chemotaxis protein
VVAEEVRNLAQRSADSVHNTNAFVNSNQAQVSNGAKISNKLATSFQLLSKSANSTITSLESIMEAINTEVKMISALGDNIKNMQSSSEKSLQNVQKILEQVANLSTRSNNLKSVINELEFLLYKKT